MKKKLLFVWLALLISLSLVGFTGCNFSLGGIFGGGAGTSQGSGEGEKEPEKEQEKDPSQEEPPAPFVPVETDELSIHFLELGNKYAGDCILIKTGDTEVLIDAGSRTSSAETIVPYIAQYCTDGILEYVIATHADQDHISAFFSTKSTQGIFASFECKTIIDFPRTNKDSVTLKNYRDARDAEVEAGAVHYTALQCWNQTDGASRSYQLAEGVTMKILYNYFYENKSSDENNYSVCMLLSQGENHYLFTGDLEEKGEEYLVQCNELPRCKLFKAGHHGSRTSSNDCLLSVIQPEIVCVCCCAGTDEYTDNPLNQFPTQDMIDRVGKYTDLIYVTSLGTEDGYTSMNGNIVVVSNGLTLTVTGSNHSTLLKDTEWFAANRVWNGVVSNRTESLPEEPAEGA